MHHMNTYTYEPAQCVLSVVLPIQPWPDLIVCNMPFKLLACELQFVMVKAFGTMGMVRYGFITSPKYMDKGITNTGVKIDLCVLD